MAKATPAIEFLTKPSDLQNVCVVFGDDDFLRRQVLLAVRGVVLGEEDAEISLTRFDGSEVELSDVFSELETVAMFGSGRRLVVIEQADDFVTRYRAALEEYVASPREAGVLVLELKSFASNTRLYKAVVAKGKAIDAKAPQGERLVQWLTEWTARHHAAEMTPAAAELLVEMIGPELGILDQEAARLALSVGSDGRITPQLVKQHVGTWRAKTAWDMIDAALDGKLPEAMRQMELLLGAGEQPIGVLAQISYPLRQMAAATRLILQGEASGRRVALAQALERAGVRAFVVRRVEPRLRRLGRERGGQLYRWLLQADLDLKGASPAPPRLILERLIVRLAAPSDALKYPTSRD